MCSFEYARYMIHCLISEECPIILLDDPLSAVDSSCAKHIFQK